MVKQWHVASRLTHVPNHYFIYDSEVRGTKDSCNPVSTAMSSSSSGSVPSLSSVTSPCLHTTETTIIELRGTGGHSFPYLPVSLQRAGSVFWNYAQGICRRGIYGSMHTQSSLLKYEYLLSSENFIRPCYWGGNSLNYFCIPSRVVMWKLSRFLFGGGGGTGFETRSGFLHTAKTSHSFSHSGQAGHDRSF
jgi:hypothetical protein